MSANTEIKSVAEIHTWQERLIIDSDVFERTHIEDEIADLRAYAERLEKRVAAAQKIVDAVRKDGDPAFAHLLHKFDGA